MSEIVPINMNDFWVPEQGHTYRQFEVYCKDNEGIKENDLEIIRENAKKILERCIKPNTNKEFNRTNLHIGDVQSGKTLTMTAAIALAHDNNFLLTTILSGTKKILKAQNETRIESILQKIDKDKDKFYFYRGDDAQLKTQIEKLERKPKLGGMNKMVVSIILKEPTNIDKLTSKLKEFNIKDKVYGSLILDDEADQASLNTLIRRKGEKSSTYKLINSLIKSHSSHTTFIQVTATASALFCIPSDDPLSPKYVSISRRSEKYIGIHTYFRNQETIAAFVENICDEDIPDSSDENGLPPQALIDSLDYYIIAVAVAKFFKVEGPFTYLCHPDSLTSQHEKYHSWILKRFENLYSVLHDDESLLLKKLNFRTIIENIANKKGFPSFSDWSQIQLELIKIIDNSPIISIINKDNQIPDLKNFWDQSNTHIIIGAMSIERGFTVEGLLVTYLSRKPGKNADNIQQRARFCGYKNTKHLALSKLWLDKDNLNFFKSALITENAIRHGLGPHLHLEKPYRKEGFAIPVKKPFRPTRTNIHEVLNTDGIFGWFYPKYAQYLEFDKRENNKFLVQEIIQKYKFESQTHRNWRCISTDQMKIKDLKLFLNKYETCESDKNHLAMLNTALQNNLTQFNDDDEILTCVRIPLLRNTNQLDHQGYIDNPTRKGIKYKSKAGERIRKYELPEATNFDRGYDPKKKWLGDKSMVNLKRVTLHLNLVKFYIANPLDFDDDIECDKKLKQYFEKEQTSTFIIHVKFPDLDDWKFYSQ